MLEFCTLGTGGTLPIPERALSSLYVRVNGRALLIDCGEGTQVGIRRLGWGFRCLDGLLLTHYHGDHCTGLAGLLLSLEKAGRDEPFHIWGPKGLKRVVEGLCVIVPPLSFAVMLHELPPEGGEAQMIGLKIRAFPVDHGGIPCFGYRLVLERSAAWQKEAAEKASAGTAGGAAALDEASLKLVGSLLEALYADNGDFALRQLKQLRPWLNRHGIELKDYGPETAELFELLPSKKTSATLRPALVAGEKLLLVGRATEPAEN